MLSDNKNLSKRIIFKDKHTIKLFSPAKVNLTLKVIGRLKNGYHLIQSIICPVSLADCLTLEIDQKRKNIACEVNLSKDLEKHFAALKKKDPGLSKPYLTLNTNENLVIKALDSVLQAANLKNKFGLKVKIEKHIPLGAGLGGGSSNAASAIKALLELLTIDLSPEVLRVILSKIGADIPVFFNEGLSFVSGIGEKVKPLSGKGRLYLQSLKALIVKPLISVNTKEAYGFFGLEPKVEIFEESLHGLSSAAVKRLLEVLYLESRIPENSNNLLTLLEQKCICDMNFSETSSNLLSNFFNDFQIPIFQRYQEIKNCFEQLVANGAKKVLLTGSGSALLAFFDSNDLRRKAEQELFKIPGLFCKEVDFEV